MNDWEWFWFPDAELMFAKSGIILYGVYKNVVLIKRIQVELMVQVEKYLGKEI